MQVAHRIHVSHALLACQCLEDTLTDRHFLVFEPIMATHWLPVNLRARYTGTHDTLIHMP